MNSNVQVLMACFRYVFLLIGNLFAIALGLYLSGTEDMGGLFVHHQTFVGICLICSSIIVCVAVPLAAKVCLPMTLGRYYHYATLNPVCMARLSDVNKACATVNLLWVVYCMFLNSRYESYLFTCVLI